MSFLGSNKTAETTQTIHQDYRQTDAKVAADNSKVFTNAGGTIKGSVADYGESIGAGKRSRVRISNVYNGSYSAPSDIARAASGSVGSGAGVGAGVSLAPTGSVGAEVAGGSGVNWKLWGMVGGAVVAVVAVVVVVIKRKGKK